MTDTRYSLRRAKGGWRAYDTERTWHGQIRATQAEAEADVRRMNGEPLVQTTAEAAAHFTNLMGRAKGREWALHVAQGIREKHADHPDAQWWQDVADLLTDDDATTRGKA